VLQLAVLAAAVQAQPEVVLRSEKMAAPRKIDIQVERLSVLAGGEPAQAAAALVDKVIAMDLHYSGFFRVGGPLAPVQHTDLKLDFVIEGSLEQSGPGGAPVLSLSLLAQHDRQLLLGKRYQPTDTQLRSTAHHFVDQVVQLLTGVKGICLTRIVFARGTGDRRDLYVVDYDGENLLRLTANRTLNLLPSWSPDSRLIAFTSYTRDQQGIYLLETQTGKVRQLTATPGLNVGPNWHPNGQELLISLSKDGNPEIYRVDLTGRILRRLTHSPAIEVSACWSPNGRDIVFTSDRTGLPQLYIMDAEGAGRNRLTFEGDYNDSAAWSPTGEWIAYATRMQNRTHLVLIGATGEDRRLLTDRSWRNCEDPSWAPDGRHLVFSSDRTGVFKLYVMDVLDNGWRQLTFGGEPDITPAWSP
jgi:TolB protein